MKTYSRKKSGENSDVIINLNELCRLCLSKDEELVPIFCDEEPIPLTLRIMACVSLEVNTAYISCFLMNIILNFRKNQTFLTDILFIRRYLKEMDFPT